ncbi:TB2/DP1, HVA22 family-domain-containing protein [Halteromyces radiatus]|uniref:TB2/DP1, HVA22 family-domain-containing protein n=1 Tax=Halteromyces radiatus TaxID=101107 RepID=UPI00221F112D|nr:TB2/DP1, HVA22 family-domain-containing protein [Halteromyces radiatus]KAI8093547.1 TB2/DP1, HVA22 family-domain-containing protein [Halteromyces radiatus]
MTTTNTKYSAEGIQQRAQQLFNKVDVELSQYKYANEVERLTGVRKSYIAAGIAGIFTIMIFFNLAGQLLTNTISWIYPAYASFKAIETPATDDDKQWLTYWTVIGFVQMIEYFSDILLFWFPFYYLFKTVLILWLALPQFRGAEILYSRFLRPQLLKLQGDIDHQAHELRDKVGNIANDILGPKKD